MQRKKVKINNSKCISSRRTFSARKHGVTTLALAGLLVVAAIARADYLGSENVRIFPIPLDDIADGYDVGDRIQFVIEVTPRDTGSVNGHAAWSTFYVPDGVVVVDVAYVQIGAGGAYVKASADDVDATYNGYGVRGAVGYGAGLGEGYVNEVQQDTGAFYSTDARTHQQFAGPNSPNGFDTVEGTGVDPSMVYNVWDRDQTVAFGEGGALSGNGGKGNTPIVLGTPNRGTGSPVAGPDVYYTNDYNPSRGGSLVNRLSGVGPWQRIEILGDKIGGSGAVTPANAQGAINNTAVPASGGFVLTGSNSLPANTNAVRIVHGARRLGDLERWSITLELTDVAMFLAELDGERVCADSIPGDTSTVAAKDNNWRYYEVSRSCADLNSTAVIVKEIIDPVSATAVQTSQIITYEFTIYNLSANNLTNVVPRDQGITDVTLVSLATAGCNAGTYTGSISTGGNVAFTGISGNVASWATIPTLAPGASASFRMCGRATASFGEVTRNQARADYAGCGTSPCLTSDAIIPVSNRIAGTVYADTDSSGTFTSGEQGIPAVVVGLYRDVNNNGIYNPATDVLLSETLTATDGSYEFMAIPSGNYIIVQTNLPDYISTGDIDNSTLNCGAGNGCDTIGDGSNGTASSIQVTNSTNLENQDFFDVPPFPDVSIVKSAAPNPVSSGDELVFTLTATNSASSLLTAPSVEINDVLPAGLTWVSTNNSNGGGTCTVGNLGVCNCSLPGNTGTVTCEMGFLAIGQSKTITITTTVD